MPLPGRPVAPLTEILTQQVYGEKITACHRIFSIVTNPYSTYNTTVTNRENGIEVVKKDAHGAPIEDLS